VEEVAPGAAKVRQREPRHGVCADQVVDGVHRSKVLQIAAHLSLVPTGCLALKEIGVEDEGGEGGEGDGERSFPFVAAAFP
jgi:hypothetical protein